MSSITITFVEPDGVEKVVDDAVEGESLMDIAKNNGIAGILGDCGGGCACATCHVYIPPEWQEAVGGPDDIEEMTLDMAGDAYQPNSRLSCQIQARPELDGLKVIVAPVDF